MDLNKHKYFMLQILKDIYSDLELAIYLGFKGGTALMFFYDLPRFSVDLDFNLLQPEKENEIYEKIRAILLKYGKIHDEAQKFFGPIVVLDYGIGERKLKVEISNRLYDNHYEVKNFIGINMLVMTQADMFAHKLCALLDRNELTNRDIFDCWFFMERRTPVNKTLVEIRMNKLFSDYLQDCINKLNAVSDKRLLNGIGDLIDDKMKTFIRTKLRTEAVTLLKFYQQFPILK
ncbi:hypothetical protein FACS1894199_17140 [Bacteroidia bacterium]|nr:hypothetical protein FACS1894199_17140 [Bacteroidia bacterium]